MTNELFKRALVCAAVATALGLPAGAANAVVYSSTFDPPDFEGIATFDVDQACLNVGTGFQNNPDFYTGCTVNWLSATVTLKDDPATPRTFSYDPAFLPSLTAVNDIFVRSGELAGVNSDVIGPVILTDPNPNFSGPFWIEYVFSQSAALFAAAAPGVSPSNGTFGLGIVNLYRGSCTASTTGGPNCVRNEFPSDVAQVENFTRVSQVPEPGILGLILGAIGGIWFVRRRTAAAA